MEKSLSATRMVLKKENLSNDHGSGGLEIAIEGFTGDPTETSPGTAVFLENYKGEMRVVVWDGTKVDPQIIILKKS
jgi:hypothetical protein